MAWSTIIVALYMASPSCLVRALLPLQAHYWLFGEWLLMSVILFVELHGQPKV